LATQGDGQFHPSHCDFDDRTTLESLMAVELLDGAFFGAMLGLEKSDWLRRGPAYLQQLYRDMAVNDPLERMLVEQLAWTHQRLKTLSLIAIKAEGSPERQLATSDQCDKAMNAFRRGMLALKQYRSRRAKAPRVAIQQVNESGPGHVLVTGEADAPENVTNEQGANHGE
jgi:hypothetical protein